MLLHLLHVVHCHVNYCLFVSFIILSFNLRLFKLICKDRTGIGIMCLQGPYMYRYHVFARTVHV